MNYFEKMNEVVNEFAPVKKVSATVDGKHYMLDEYQVRALQILCKRVAAESDGVFEDFVSRVTIWGGVKGYGAKHHPKYGYSMVFRKDGYFANDFAGGNHGCKGIINLAAELL